jgi:hypothetical protein
MAAGRNGIEMTEQEIIKAAKTNWLAWQGLRELQPEVADWMESHAEDCRVLFGINFLGKVAVKYDCPLTIYRLRPDYEPEPVARWWFCPTINRTHQQEGNVCSACMEVTSEYAGYLRNKPDGECELRTPKKGDLFYENYGNSFEWDRAENDWDVFPYPQFHLRWCRPKQPEAGWREYAVKPIDGEDYICADDDALATLDVAKREHGAYGRFGGVQFEGQKGGNWFMQTSLLMTANGTLTDSDCDYNLMPAVPVKARFLEAQ